MTSVVKKCCPGILVPANTSTQRSYFLDNLCYTEHLYKEGGKKCCCCKTAPFTQLFLSFRKAPSDAQNTRTGHGPLDWQYLLPPSYRSNDHLTIERHGNAADALPKFNVFARALMDCVATQGCCSKITPTADTCDHGIFDMIGPVYGSSEKRINALKAYHSPQVPLVRVIASLALVFAGLYFIVAEPQEDSEGDLIVGLAALVPGLLLLIVSFLPQLCGTYTLFILTDRRLVEVNQSGMTGCCSGKKKFHVQKSWMLKNLVTAQYVRENEFWLNAFACFGKCIRGKKVAQYLTFRFQGPTQHDISTVIMAPETEIKTGRVRSFFSDVLSIPGFNDQELTLPSSVTSAMPPPTASTDGLLLNDDEHVIQDVSTVNYGMGTLERIVRCLGVLAVAIASVAVQENTGTFMLYVGILFLVLFAGLVWYYCLYPRHFWSDLLLTNKRVIESGSIRVPLTQQDVGTQQTYYRFQDVKGLDVEEHPAGCIPQLCNARFVFGISFEHLASTIRYEVKSADIDKARSMAQSLMTTHPSTNTNAENNNNNAKDNLGGHAVETL